jgi:hypothetical protein
MTDKLAKSTPQSRPTTTSGRPNLEGLTGEAKGEAVKNWLLSGVRQAKAKPAKTPNAPRKMTDDFGPTIAKMKRWD